jgi:hypothetical protein
MENLVDKSQLLVKLVLNAWDTQNKFLQELISSLTDEQLAGEISPGRNSGTYLLGHLVAVSDALLPLLGFGPLLFPELEEIFLKNPDKSGLQKPEIPQLKLMLQEVNQELAAHFKLADEDEWMSRHMAVSPESFINEPHRNKLNVLISRTNHMANHIGQMTLLR